ACGWLALRWRRPDSGGFSRKIWNDSKRMKPYVICHMCTTIDGKILGDRWGKLPGGKDAATLFETTAASFGIGAWLVGTTTMDEFDGPKFKLPRASNPVAREDYIANKKARRFAIGADAKGVLRFKEGEVDGDHVVLLVTDRVSNDYLAHLQSAGVSYLFCGKKEIDLQVALRKLGSAFPLRKLMLQGGGKFNGAMLKAGLVDEISHVTVPVVDGGIGISSFFDIPGKPPHKAAATLRLLSRKQLPGSVTWVRYRVVSKLSGPG
ncbi:MAG TPA: dihydrofolate reductase family protein, partial [Clostridia bacterium]|nr:dihydrofolate reductase family protein [Clostridia bacterium]